MEKIKIIAAQNGGVSVQEDTLTPLKKGYVYIETEYSAISAGTELTIIDTSKENRIPIGYSACGRVVAVGEGVSEFSVGDKVASYGAPYTGHKSMMHVPKTLVAKIPENVTMQDASLAGLGAIAIHAIRHAELHFGEVVVVVGLGIYGQLISQIARAAGLVVFALNRNPLRADMLEKASLGDVKPYTDEKELEKDLYQYTQGQGADAVFLCTGGDSNYLTNKSLEWCRDRGVSMIVGDLQPVYDRPKMFAKEITIKVSRAGGPGRYDTSYEKNAVDYPYGYVRWTEGRNIGEYLRLVSEDKLKVSTYYDKAFDLEDYQVAYDALRERQAPVLTHLFKYRIEGK